MRDVLSAVLLAAGLDVAFFVLLIVMGWVEPEERRAVVPRSRASKPSLGTIPNVSDDDEEPRAA
jgi:hypothetical protein